MILRVTFCKHTVYDSVLKVKVNSYTFIAAYIAAVVGLFPHEPTDTLTSQNETSEPNGFLTVAFKTFGISFCDDDLNTF